jgi:hypothetical protein
VAAAAAYWASMGDSRGASTVSNSAPTQEWWGRSGSRRWWMCKGQALPTNDKCTYHSTYSWQATHATERQRPNKAQPDRLASSLYRNAA